MNLIVPIITSLLSITLLPQKTPINWELISIINNNIDLFNAVGCDGYKQRTYFDKITHSFDLYAPSSNEKIGTTIIFDDNQGYLSFNLSYEILDHNYESGFTTHYSEIKSNMLYYDGINYFDDSNIVHSKFNINSYYGEGVNEQFYWHADETFMSQKDRELLTEISPQYATRAKITSNTVFGNKIVWSGFQGSEPSCAQIALANLLWTYHINDKISLPDGCTTYYTTFGKIRSAVDYDINVGTVSTNIENVNNILTDKNYRIDDVSVINGISDTLEQGPLVALYSWLGDGHYVIVTGKGRSVYTKVLGISFYTSWDICNTWYDMENTNNGYIGYKYWVDNQYIVAGWQLEYKENGNIVSLL